MLYIQNASLLYSTTINTILCTKCSHKEICYLHYFKKQNEIIKSEVRPNTTHKVYNKYFNLDLTNYKVQPLIKYEKLFTKCIL